MQRLLASIILALLPISSTLADSCYDLWYQRNLIYAQNGYCFKTDLARRAFSEFSCWTDDPRFSPANKGELSESRLKSANLIAE